MSDYRSKFEQHIHRALGGDWDYEPLNMAYHVPRRYTPDFVYKDKVYVEAKGYFREGDTQKYRAINDECAVIGKTFVMVLMNPFKKVRKGANLTMADWCEKNDIPWFTLESIDHLKQLEALIDD